LQSALNSAIAHGRTLSTDSTVAGVLRWMARLRQERRVLIFAVSATGPTSDPLFAAGAADECASCYTPLTERFVRRHPMRSVLRIIVKLDVNLARCLIALAIIIKLFI
jgi:hypothetical protein